MPKYESGSMIALMNATGGEALRHSFTSWLTRGDNRNYMRQKWGALKPKSPGEPETRWAYPFNRPSLPVSWWQLDPARRDCLLNGGGGDAASPTKGSPCAFNTALVDEAAQSAASSSAHASGSSPPPSSGGSFASRLSKRRDAKAEL